MYQQYWKILINYNLKFSKPSQSTCKVSIILLSEIFPKTSGNSVHPKITASSELLKIKSFTSERNFLLSFNIKELFNCLNINDSTNFAK